MFVGALAGAALLHGLGFTAILAAVAVVFKKVTHWHLIEPREWAIADSARFSQEDMQASRVRSSAGAAWGPHDVSLADGHARPAHPRVHALRRDAAPVRPLHGRGSTGGGGDMLPHGHARDGRLLGAGRPGRANRALLGLRHDGGGVQRALTSRQGAEPRRLLVRTVGDRPPGGGVRGQAARVVVAGRGAVRRRCGSRGGRCGSGARSG